MTESERDSKFERDVEAYLRELPELLEDSKGKFALIGQGKLSNVYASKEEAMKNGYKKFGPGGFLAQEISKRDLKMGKRWQEACPS